MQDRVAALEERVDRIDALVAAISLSLSDLSIAAGIAEPPELDAEEFTLVGAAAGDAAPVAPQPAARRCEARNLYVVSGVPRGREADLGIWNCIWAFLKARALRGQSHAGSAVRLKKAESEAIAEARWVSEGWQLPAPRHNE